MATITKRKNSYLIRVSCGYDINGRQIVHSMTWKPEPNMTVRQTEKELQRQAVLFEDKCKTGQCLNGSIKFKDFVDIWRKEYAEKQLKASTITKYDVMLSRILPAIGHIRLDKIQPIHLTQFYNNLSEEDIKEVSYTLKMDIDPLLQERSLSRLKFANQIGVAVSCIQKLCHKRGGVTLNTAEKISSGLGYKVNDIFYHNPLDTMLGASTIRNYHRAISAILNIAIQWQVIFANPCQRVKPPKVEKKESTYLDDKEVRHLVECLSDEPLMCKAIITLLIYSGMRRGEACGLKWSDVDFENKQIKIQRNVLYLPGKGIYEDTTKTASSVRTITIADEPLKLLQQYRKEQSSNRLKCGDQWHDKNYIFTQWNGEAIYPSYISNWFHKFIKRYNLPDVHIHSLRHTNASLLIANGVNITTVAKRLGHANTAVTASVYAHAIESADEAAADTLQTLLNSKQCTNKEHFD